MIEELNTLWPDRYSMASMEVRYPNSPRRKCDVCLRMPPAIRNAEHMAAFRLTLEGRREFTHPSIWQEKGCILSSLDYSVPQAKGGR